MSSNEIPSSGSPPGSRSTLERDLDDALPSSPRASNAKEGVHLVVVSGPEAGRLFRVGHDEMVIGRDEDATIRLTDPSVSGRHAKVIFHDGIHLVVDLGSTNGTLLNDEPVETPHQLRHSDAIRVGKVVLTFLSSAGQPIGGRTIPLSRPNIRDEKPPVRAMVRHRAARLAHPRSENLDSYGPTAATQGPDWVFYARHATNYAKRYWLFLAIMTSVGATAGATHAILRPPSASAFFEITLSREAKVNPVEEEQSVQFFVAAQKSFTSTSLIRKTLNRMGAEIDDAGAIGVQSHLSFYPIDRHEQVWHGKMESNDAEKAREFLEQHLRTYLDHELDKNVHVLKAEIDLLEQQVEQSGEALRKTEDALAVFKQNNPGAVAGEGNEHYASLGSLRARRDDLSAQVERLRLELGLNRKRMESEDALLQGRVESASTYQASIRDVQKQISEAKASGLGEEHPKLKQLRAQAKQLEALRDGTIHSQVSDIDRRSNPAYVAVRERVRDLEVALRVAQTELGQVSQRLQDTEGVVENLPGAEAELAKLTRNYAGTRELHDKLFQKLQASRLQLEMERESARARYDLITPPTAAPPNLAMAMAKRGGALGFVLFFCALLIAAGREVIRYLRTVL